MKKNMLRVAIVAAIAIGVNAYQLKKANNASKASILDNIEALADDEMINPECPNGCVNNGDGCHCYHDYSGYREAEW